MRTLELGAILPGMGWEFDGTEMRDWVRGIEAIGYQWTGTNDHITFAYELPDRPGGLYSGPVYQHENLTLLAHAAACTERLILQSTVLVLTQRQPGVVAKQAAEIDVLSGGRFRLGVGLGWSEAEFESTGTPFADKVQRFEEAIAVLRACWEQDRINFSGKYITIREMSMVPKPVTPGGPPIIFGGSAEAAEERAARLGDGWIGFPDEAPEVVAARIGRMRGHLRRHGRDEAQFVFQGMVGLIDDLGELARRLRAYREVGVTSFLLTAPDVRPSAKIPVDAHLRQLERVWREVWPAVVG